MALLTKLFNKETPLAASLKEPSPVAVSVPVSAPVLADFSQLESTAKTTQDIEERLRLAVDGPTARIRQLAAEGVNEQDALARLLRESRHKDKNVYRIAREKCDAFLEIEKQAAIRLAAAVHLSESIERHCHKPFDNIYVATLDHFAAQWQSLADAGNAVDHELNTRTAKYIDKCRDNITAHLQRIANEAATSDAIANADSLRSELLASLTSTLSDLYDAASSASVEAATHATRAALQRWQASLQFKPAGKADQQQFDRLQKAIHSLASKSLKHGTLREQLQKIESITSGEDDDHIQSLDEMLSYRNLLDENLPSAIVVAMKCVEDREQAQAEQAAAQANWQRQTAGLIRKALRALQAGQTSPANGLRRAIEEKLSQHSPLPPNLAGQLRQLDTQLSVLSDWRSYAVAPKRLQLIEQMESLAAPAADVSPGTSPSASPSVPASPAINPNELAEKIKKLQDEWKLISKGNTDNTDAEWQRFHAAAQTAFQPCKEYFAKQAEHRAHNLELRQKLNSRITDFIATHNWEAPDWREVTKALRESQRLWRAYQPVERAANKPLQEQFDAQLEVLQSKLNVEYESNSTAKKRIIARAQGLLNQDARQATDEVKRLQAAWQEVGPVAHEEEQALWQAFRQQCDAVFAKRQQQYAEQSAALQGSKQQAEALCEQVEQLQSLSGAALTEAAKKLPEIREAFNDLGELPKAIARNVESRFDKALRSVDKQLSKQRELDKALAWDNVFVASDKIRAYRLALVEGLAEEQIAALKQTAQQFIDDTAGLPKNALPKNTLQVLKQQLALDPTLLSQDINANAAKLRELCTRAEILTDTPTPTEDQPARRAYQMQRLTQGFGQGAQTIDTMESLILEWIAVGVINEADHVGLLQRINRSRTASK